MHVKSEYEEKTISLLRFALNCRGIVEGTYFIGDEGQEKTQNDKLCLLKSEDDHWIVLYIERGNISQRVEHPSIRFGAQDFFWKLARKDTPWDYREEWEAKFGQSL